MRITSRYVSAQHGTTIDGREWPREAIVADGRREADGTIARVLRCDAGFVVVRPADAGCSEAGAMPARAGLDRPAGTTGGVAR